MSTSERVFEPGLAADFLRVVTTAGSFSFKNQAGTERGSYTDAGAWSFPVSVNCGGVLTFINGNEIHVATGTNADSDVYWAYKGYASGVTRFRNTYFCNGKAGIVGSYSGITGAWTFGAAGTSTASVTLSGVYSGLAFIPTNSSSGFGTALIQAGVNNTATDVGNFVTFGVPASRGYSWCINNVAKLFINTDGAVYVPTLAGTGTRTVYSDPSGGLTNTASDMRLKTEFTPIVDALSMCLSMKPGYYHWLDTEKRGAQREVGFKAQEIQEILPEVIGTNYDGMLSLDYSHMTAVLVKAIQELSSTVDELKREIKILKGE